MSVARSIELGAQRSTLPRVPVRPANDPARAAANRAAIAAAGEPADHQARLRADRARRAADAIPCNDMEAAA